MKPIKIFVQLKVVISLTILALVSPVSAQELIHPGGMQTQEALTLIRDRVAQGVEPWRSAWAELERTDAMKDYRPDPRRNITISQQSNYQRDGHAAYVLAVKWAVSGDIEYAEAARRVIDAWVDTSRTFDDFSTRPLRNGIASIQMANAAEILAHAFNGSAGWPQADIDRAKDWFRTYIDPTITTGPRRSSNFGTSALAGSIAIAIFLDDREKFNDAVFAYRFGFQNTDDGCAHVTDYIWHPSGQSSESGRDQVHTEGGIGHLVETALMARNQGVDLVSFADNRLVAGMEYTAAYNLGNEVTFLRPLPDECNVYPESHNNAISPEGRFEFAPVWEMANTLFNDFNIPHPFTSEVVNSEGFTYYPDRNPGGRYRPESTNSDNPGMGTLLYSAPGRFPTEQQPNPTNTSPTLDFATPNQNSVLEEGEQLTVRVNAGDTDGDIISVSLSLNGNAVRTERRAPYRWSDRALQDLPEGRHTLTAVATDNDGLTTEVSISITVGEPTSGGLVSMRKANSSSFAIDGQNGAENRQNVHLWPYNRSNQNQHWEEISRGGDFYSYRKRGTNHCLDGGNGGANRQTVYLWQCSDNNQNQHWRKVRIGNNFRLEKRNAPDFSIDGNNGGANAQDIYLFRSSNTNLNQQWIFRDE